MEQEIEVIREQEEQEIEIQNENISIEIVNDNYEDLENLPQINNVELIGNLSSQDLGLQPAGDYALESEIPTKTSDLTNDSGFITGYIETDPTVPSYVKNITQANITSWNNKSDFSGSYDDLTNKPTIPDVSNFITKDVNDLTYYTLSSNLATVATSGNYNDLTNKPDLSSYATTTSLGNEITARENADVGLQEQIDAINTTIGDIDTILTRLTTGSGV